MTPCELLVVHNYGNTAVAKIYLKIKYCTILVHWFLLVMNFNRYAAYDAMLILIQWFGYIALENSNNLDLLIIISP